MADSSSQTRKAKRQVSDKNVCIFCDEQGNDLHQVLTLEVNVNEMAIQMQDSQMIAKLAAADMVAIEANITRVVCLHISVSTRHMLKAVTELPNPLAMLG